MARPVRADGSPKGIAGVAPGSHVGSRLFFCAMDRKSRQVGAVPVDVERIRALCEPIAAAHGTRLLDVEWTTGPPGRILRVTLDAGDDAVAEVPNAGVTLDDCVRVSRDVSTLLDVEDLIPQSYHLEVSSPGLDRALRSPDELRAVVGQRAKVKLSRPAPDGQRVLRGLVLALDDDVIRMEVDGNEHEVPLADVAEATKVVEFGGKAQRRPSTRGTRAPGSERSSRRGVRRDVATEIPAEPTGPGSRKGS